MSALDWLFNRRNYIPIVFPVRGSRRPTTGAPRQSGSIPIVFPLAGPARGTGSPTVFGPEVNVSTYHPEAVVYGEGELFDIPENPEIPLNRWIKGDSSAIKSYMFQTYRGQRGIGSIWIQFVGGKKRYNYPNVPYREFVELHNSPSQGRFVNHVLRPLYSVGQGRNWRMRAGRRHVRRTRRH